MQNSYCHETLIDTNIDQKTAVVLIVLQYIFVKQDIHSILKTNHSSFYAVYVNIGTKEG